MRMLWLMATVILTASGLPALAEDAPLPQTMGAQLERMRQSGEYMGATPYEQREAPVTVPPKEQVHTLPADAEKTPAAETTNQAATPALAPEVVAYQSMIESQGGGAIAPVPLEMRTNGQATYITGGISEDELVMLKAHANKFNLQVLLSKDGHYLVADYLHIMDPTGLEVVRVEEAGPYVYAELTPGTYTVEASLEGEIKNATVTIKETGTKKLSFAF